MFLSSLDKRLAIALFIVLFILRYLRTVVSIFTFLMFKPKPVSEKPRYTWADTTVVIPTTFKHPAELVQCLRSIVDNRPAHIILVTSRSNVELVKTCCQLNHFKDVRVFGVERLHKRIQMMRAVVEVTTDITVFCDDDVTWPSGYLDLLLAVFENPNVGAGGTRQRVRRNKDHINFWNFLGICYLERRVWNNVSTNAIDGSLSTLSGRTAAYRTKILNTEEFRQYFLEDSWNGQKLNSDDDKCLTRYVFSHEWEIPMQFDSRAVLETTLEDNPKFLLQCVRWARAHWRGNLTVMAEEGYWRSMKYCWGLYVIYIGSLQTPAGVHDGILFLLLHRITIDSPEMFMPMVGILCAWIMFTKVVKLIPHFLRHPGDLKFIPVSIAFSYLHGFINIYALLTLHVTTWGSQDLDEPMDTRAEKEEVLPMLMEALAEEESYAEPQIARIMAPDECFSAKSMVHIVDNMV